MNIYYSLKIDKFTTDFYQRIDLSDYVIFIENNNQEDVVNYIKSNYNAIQLAFKNKRKRFILWSEIVNQSSNLESINYFHPRLIKYNNLELLNFEAIKNYLGYNGNITTGFLSIDTSCEFIQFESNSAADFKQIGESFLSNIYIEEVDYMPAIYDGDENINLDKETKEAIDIIFNQFRSLKDNGNLLQVLPIVQQYLKTQQTAQLNELSTLKIDENYTIFLRDYNLEIKLSHLTKSIYLLFLNHPEGILLTELNLYRKELLELYKSISNRLDFDKMNESIDDLIVIGSNTIYVHLSRIKSAFTKVIHHSIAEYYFIDGGKSKSKKIKISNKLIQWHNKGQKIPETPLPEKAIMAIEKAKALLRKLGIDEKN
jgi:hypothetical protein